MTILGSENDQTHIGNVLGCFGGCTAVDAAAMIAAASRATPTGGQQRLRRLLAVKAGAHGLQSAPHRGQNLRGVDALAQQNEF